MIDFHIHSYFSDGDQTPKEIQKVALRRQLSAIAITDHSNNAGRFMYLRDVSEPRPLREYIDEIHDIQTTESIKTYIGIELCEFLPNTDIPQEFSEFDFILIETFPVQNPSKKAFDPFEEALKLKKQFACPIGLAHPTLHDIEQNIEKFDQYSLFIELNFDKLIDRPAEQERVFKRTAEILHSTSKVQLSIGSDAHIIFLIGAVKPIWDFLVQENFQNRLILVSK
jgi:histidinol phosphatase-like PHP family hydrolase